MRKESKLREKPARLPDTGELERSGQIQDYLEEVARLNLETARCQRFLLLLRDLFGEAKAGFVEEYLQGMEKYVRVKQKDILLRGRIDTLYGNLVIEFEADLGKSLAEAKEQLRKYTACLWSEPAERTVNYLCLATDGIKSWSIPPRPQSLSENPFILKISNLRKSSGLIFPTSTPTASISGWTGISSATPSSRQRPRNL